MASRDHSLAVFKLSFSNIPHVMAREDEEWVSKREFEILKEEFAGIKSEMEKRNKDIQSLKRGKHVVGLGSTTNGHVYNYAS